MQSLTLTRPYMNIYRAPDSDGLRALLLVVLLQVIDGTAISLTFANHSILNRLLPEAEARAYLEFLKAEAAAGTGMHLLIERAGMFTSAMAAADDAEQDLIDRLNASLDQDHADLTARMSAQVEQVADIVTGPRTGWTGIRTAAKNQALGFRRIRPTRTGVHVKPLTGPMLDLIRNHRAGVVTTRPGQSWTVLRGIVERGYGKPVYRPGTRIITAARLNERGLAVAKTSEEIAA